MKANLTGFGLQRRSPAFLALLSPRAADGPLCEVACFPFQRLHAVLTSDRHVDVWAVSRRALICWVLPRDYHMRVTREVDRILAIENSELFLRLGHLGQL